MFYTMALAKFKKNHIQIKLAYTPYYKTYTSNMNTDPIIIETDHFFFKSPKGWQTETLDDEAELVGPNEEFMVISSYQIDKNSSDDEKTAFNQNICNAMIAASEDSELTVNQGLKKEVTPSGLPVWKLLSQTTDNEAFFDQYLAIENNVAVVVTVEGDLKDRSSSALIEESVYCIDFKT